MALRGSGTLSRRFAIAVRRSAIAVALPATVVTTLNSDHNGSVAMLGRTPSTPARPFLSVPAIMARQCSFCTCDWEPTSEHVARPSSLQCPNTKIAIVCARIWTLDQAFILGVTP